MSYFPKNVKKSRKFIKEDILKQKKRETDELARTVAACCRAKVFEDIRKERHRQIEKEGFDAVHDQQHSEGRLALAAGCYAAFAFRAGRDLIVPDGWPWHHKWWKPKTPRKDLIRAAALIVAELEKLDASSSKKGRRSR